jgi:hypothetical protein
LSRLGFHLETANQRIVAYIRRGPAADLSLDTRLVVLEQRIAQAHLENSRLQIATWSRISRELNELLNGSHIACRIAPFLPHSRLYQAVLDEVRRPMRMGLDFADESHRITIGCTLIRHLRAADGYRDEGKLVTSDRRSLTAGLR